jgi:hypothetical protein
MGAKRSADRILVGKPEGKRPLRRPRRRGRIILNWSGMDWIDLAEKREQWMVLVNTAVNLRVP